MRNACNSHNPAQKPGHPAPVKPGNLPGFIRRETCRICPETLIHKSSGCYGKNVQQKDDLNSTCSNYSVSLLIIWLYMHSVLPLYQLLFLNL